MRLTLSLRFQAIEYDGKFFVNPGTATGAWTGAYNGHVFFIYIYNTFNVNFFSTPATPFLPLH